MQVQGERKQAPIARLLMDARSLLAEYQLVARSLEPLLFLLGTATTVFLVLDLFFCTEASTDHLVRSLIFLHHLIMNSCQLYHLSVTAEDCYTDMKSVLVLLR